MINFEFKWKIIKPHLLILIKKIKKENLNLTILIGHLMGKFISFKKD